MKNLQHLIAFRFLIAIAALILFLPNLKAQSCYEIISDNTGMDITSYQSELEAAACALRDAFPEEFQSQFKVYDFGFYLHNEVMESGYQAVFDKFKTHVASQSNYYLILGRQISDNQGISKIWTDFLIPGLENFKCIEEIEHLKLQIQNIGNDNPKLNEFAAGEVKIMDFLKKRIECKEICDNGIDDDGDGWIDCNDPDCWEELGRINRTMCTGQALFLENSSQLFGFDDNKIKAYPTYKTDLGDGFPWKSLGIGVSDQVNVEFSEQLVLSDLIYIATGVEILGSNIPQNHNETITIIGNSYSENAKIEVKDIGGNTIGGLMIKVLPAKTMILNFVLMKLPDDPEYPDVNFTISDMESVLNNCYKQINITWTINPIDQYEYDFDLNESTYLDGIEDWDILHNFIRTQHEDKYWNEYWPNENQTLFESTSTFVMYNKIQGESGEQTNGWQRMGDIYGVVNCSYQHNKRTVAHENGHRLGFNHPWEEFEGSYFQYDDVDALMDYVNILTGFRIRAYQWTK